MENIAIISASLNQESTKKKDQEILNLVTSLGFNPSKFYFQELKEINKNTYLGSGKISEIKMYIDNDPSLKAVVFNFDLTSLQYKNLSRIFSLPIYDRTGIILEIFARNAKTKEAKLQVEIAYLEYQKAKLVNTNANYEQVSSGSGFKNKGSGEKQIDLDRYHYRVLLKQKNDELATLVTQRKNTRNKRNNTGLPLIAIVGYTNAGKSTLMNQLLKYSKAHEDKQVLQENRLFATLETSTRLIEAKDYPKFLLTDTVGFIDDLPTTLVKAFRSTLEEINDANLLIQVVDVSDPNFEQEIDVTNHTLKEIGIKDIPMIYLFNKFDKLQEVPFKVNDDSLFITLKDNLYLNDVLDLIFKKLSFNWNFVSLKLPYSENIYKLKQTSFVTSISEDDDGYNVTCYISNKELKNYEKYIVVNKYYN